jgi:YqzH-like protein
MEKKFVVKMIENCFKQYGHNRESLPLNEDDCEQLYQKVMDLIEEEPLSDLYTIINDVVYEYLTE